MDYFSKEGIEALLENEAVRKRLLEFASADGSDYFQEVQSALSPEELEEYLKENPDERQYLKSSEQNLSEAESLRQQAPASPKK